MILSMKTLTSGFFYIAVISTVFLIQNVVGQEPLKQSAKPEQSLSEDELEKQEFEADFSPLLRRWKKGEEFHGEVWSAYTNEKWIDGKDSPYVRIKLFTVDLNNDGKTELILGESCGWRDKPLDDICLISVNEIRDGEIKIIATVSAVKSFEVKNSGVNFLDIEFERINDKSDLYKEIYRFDGSRYKLLK